MLEYIQDVYDVVIEYEPYHRMMTDCLMEILYLPVVFQSLCNYAIKPKLQIQTALFLLSQSISAIKDDKLSGLLLELTFGD